MNQQQPLFPYTPLPPVIVMQQFPAPGFYGDSSFYAGPVYYQGMASRPSQHLQQPNQQYYQPRRPGPAYQGIMGSSPSHWQQPHHPSQYQAPRSGPIYHGMPGPSSHNPQHPNPNQYRPPNSGPSRNRRKKGARKAETPYAYHLKHESSGTANYDPSTGIDSRIDANDPRLGKVWRSPSTTPLMADFNLT